MDITFLGTGTSQGIPVIGCKCEVCSSSNQKDKRLRCSVWLRNAETSIIIDTGPDFRYQMLRTPVDKVDAVLYTHGHKDHLAGLDDIRAYNHLQQKDIDLYANAFTCNDIRREFYYAFSDDKYPGIPQLDLHEISTDAFYVQDMPVQPIKVWHHELEVLGFRIGDFTYITDANKIEDAELDKIKNTKILVINALRNQKHISHFSLPEAIEIAQKVGAEQTYFTHISHQLGLHDEVNNHLPPNMFLAYDGLTLKIPTPH